MTSVSAYLRQNVLGLVAIFLALTGGAYAAAKVSNQDLATGAVDSRTLARGAVEGADIHNKAVGPKKIKLKKLVHRLQRRVSGTCPEGESIQGILASGAVICAKDDANEGTITGITPSDGLTGGGSSGNVDLGVDPAVIQSRVADPCPAGEAVTAIAQDGGVTCEPVGTGTVTSVGSGFGLTGGTITDSGSIAADPAVLQRRLSGPCGANRAVQSVAQDGTVSCSQAFADRSVAQASNYIQLNPDGSSATLLNHGGALVRATCTNAGNALVEVGSNGGASQFLNYQIQSTTVSNAGGTVTNGDFVTMMDATTSGRGDFNLITSTFGQLDGSFFGWSASTTGGIACIFSASALVF